MVCKNCGHQNPEGNRFCGFCGMPLCVETGAPVSAPATDQGSYVASDAPETWICPNDETENTGDVCGICGRFRPEEDGQRD